MSSLRKPNILKSTLLRLALALSLAGVGLSPSEQRRQACQSLKWRFQHPASRPSPIIITITALIIVTITVIIITGATTIIITTIITAITITITTIITIMEPIPASLSAVTAAEVATAAAFMAADILTDTAAAVMAEDMVVTNTAI